MRLLSIAFALAIALLLATSPAFAQSDTEPPVLTDFDFNPKSVDVTSGAASVMCDVSATDLLAGVKRVHCRFHSPSLRHSADCLSYTPSSGTIHDGTWTCSAVVSQYVEEGTWLVERVNLMDHVGNDHSYETSELAQSGYPTELSVVSNEDLAAPTLSGFDFNPKSVDVTSGPASVMCDVSATDLLAGVKQVHCRFHSPSLRHSADCLSYTPSSGTIHDGTWTCSAVVSQYVEEGTWLVERVNLMDQVGNDHSYETSELALSGYPTELSVVSNEDLAPPTLSDFDFNPKSVDVTSGPASVMCDVSATDLLTGVKQVHCRFHSPSLRHSADCLSYTPSSGSIHDGTWTCSAVVPQYVEEGTWLVERVNLMDQVGNDHSYETSELALSGYPTELLVGFLFGAPRASITSPSNGTRIRGNSVTIRAQLTQGSPAGVSPTLGVRFDYRTLPLGVFAPIPARNANHPNPDTSYPYFIHWDVSQVADGDYELRAVAHDEGGAPDPSPQASTMTIDHGGSAGVDENVNADGRQDSHTTVDDAVESRAASGDRTTTSAATELTIPAGALSAAIDRARLYYTDPMLEAPKLEQPDQSLGIFVDVSLESGQSTLASGLASGLNITYSDSDQDGVVDGTSVREDEIEFRRYDPGSDSYLIVPGAIMTEHNMVHTDTTVTGRFALTGPQLPKVSFISDRVTLAWDSIAAAMTYSVYRNDIADLVDGDADGLPDNGYGDCMNHLDPDTTDTMFVDEQIPGTPGAGFTYLVTFDDGSQESSLGNTSRGLRREASSACP